MKINLDDAEIISVNDELNNKNRKNRTSIHKERRKSVHEKFYENKTNWDDYNWRTDDWLEMDE